MDGSITICEPRIGYGQASEPILRALPQWFGIEEALVKYVNDAGKMPTIFAMDGARAVGFLTINRHFSESAEVHCMGLDPAYHRQGIGRRMQLQAEAFLRREGVRFLQVKTIAETSSSVPYALTRQFYLGMGYTPMEIFPELWGSHNPCLMLVKHLD